jgi:hypothetical protein
MCVSATCIFGMIQAMVHSESPNYGTQKISWGGKTHLVIRFILDYNYLSVRQLWLCQVECLYVIRRGR